MTDHWDENTFNAYFLGQMEPEARSEFENALRDDEELRQSYALFYSLKEAAASIHRDEIRNRLDNVQLTHDSETRKKGNILIWAIGMVSILVCVGYFIYRSNNQTHTGPELFASYYEIYNPAQLRGETDEFPLYTSYNNRQYKLFIQQLNDHAELKSDELILMQAISFIQLEEFDRASQSLAQLRDESSLRDRKYWYLALISIQKNDYTQAMEFINQLMSMSNYKKQEVTQLQKKLQPD